MKIWTSLLTTWLAASYLSTGSDTWGMILAATVLLGMTLEAIGGHHEKI